MKRKVLSGALANKIYLLFFLLIFSSIFLVMGKELFFPAPPVPIIDVAKERAKITQAGLEMTTGRFYKVIGGEVVK